MASFTSGSDTDATRMRHGGNEAGRATPAAERNGTNEGNESSDGSDMNEKDSEGTVTDGNNNDNNAEANNDEEGHAKTPAIEDFPMYTPVRLLGIDLETSDPDLIRRAMGIPVRKLAAKSPRN